MVKIVRIVDPIKQSHLMGLGEMRKKMERPDFFSFVGWIRRPM
jgi:hypothetical protein